MADIIELQKRLRKGENVISLKPLEFRRGPWRSGHLMLCSREESVRFEAHREEALETPGHDHLALVPTHFVLDGGCHFTAIGLFRHREDEERMRRVYRLAGLMECVTNAPSPVLRTDLLRRFYETILKEREALGVFWRGNIRHFLLPLHPGIRHPNLFLNSISEAASLKELYEVIREETDIQFDILAKSYVFYLPERAAGGEG